MCDVIRYIRTSLQVLWPEHAAVWFLLMPPDRAWIAMVLSSAQRQADRVLALPRVRFVFTVDFDPLSSTELAEQIYNADYIRADPDFAGEGPTAYANFLDELLSPVRHRIEAIDFGGGDGLLPSLARERGFTCYDTYDPFFDNQSWPTRRYDLVTAFEVVEHSRDPLGTFREMQSLLEPGGAVVFSTLVQPKGVNSGWWYIAPRNGHFSIHTNRSLWALAGRLGMHCLSVFDSLHMLYPSSGSWVARFIASRRTRSALRWASLRNAAALASTSVQLVRLGCVRPCLDPRHLARLLLGERGVAHAGEET